MGRRSHDQELSKRAHEDRQQAALFVGIGASAGGLEPLQQFFARLPANTGLVFVVVQHLEPQGPSLLADLLARHASVPVVEVADGMRPEADHVYVVVPGALLTLEAGTFRVTASAAPSAQGSINVFFRSLAAERGEHAVAIVLSGAGHDGTAGLRAIKEQGGLTLAQAPDTAKHDSMPESAIEAGLVDHVLPPAQLAAKLLEHAGYVTTAASAGATAIEPLVSSLGRICSIIRKHTGHDFASYKEGTLLRRIRRRMQVLHLAAVEEYVEVLEKDAAEAQALLKDLLIGVTQFFRDPEAFQALAQQVVPVVVGGRAPAAPARIWIVGCASGEEAYSIAILVREHLERLGANRLVQIFATDLDAEMLAEARQGRYPLSIAEHVGPERLARFFAREGESYRASKELREMCIFSQHSLIRDPPFSHLDLISCRNVLIYLSAELQGKLVPLFHYALRPGGFLFLGPSEGLAGSPALFETFDKPSRVFRRRETVARPAVDFPLAARAAAPAAPLPITAPLSEGAPPTLEQRASAAFERMTLDEYAPPCVVVNDRAEVVLVAGKTGRFFQSPSGIPTTHLVEMAPAGLKTDLRVALHTAAASQRRVVRDNVAVELEDGMHRVRLTVRPLPGIEHEARLLAVVVQEHGLVGLEELEPLPSSAEQPAIERLEGELRTTRAELKTTVEALESANEELKSSNEELISTNEELQSANEELQSSQEELQSLNEELETVNAELRQKVDELGTANSDLSNLFTATEVATIFLSRDLRIVKFTPAATELFRLVDTDVGRPIGDFAPRFVGQDVATDARAVLDRLKPVERQVRSSDGHSWFLLRLLPYRTVENVIAGVVVTFVDVSELKRAEEALRLTQASIDVAAEMVAWFTPDGRIRYANDATCQTLGYSREELLKMTALDFSPGFTWQQYADHWREVRERKSFTVEVTHRRKDGSEYPAEVLVNHVVYGGQEYIFAYGRNIAERKRADAALRESEERLRLFIDHAPASLAMFDREMRYLSASRRWLADFGLGGRDLRGLSHYEVFPEISEEWKQVHRRALGGEVVRAEVDRFARADGSVHWLRWEVRPWHDAAGSIGGIVIFSEDITPIVSAHEKIRESEKWLQVAQEAAGAGTWQWNLDTNENIWSDGLWNLYGLEKGSRTPSYDAWREAIVPEDRERAAAAVSAAARSGRELTVEFRTRQEDGGVRHILSRGQAIFDESGRPEKYVGIALDITDRMAAEEAKSRLGAIVEDSEDAILAEDLEGTILSWNNGAERMLGYSAEEAVGQPLSILLPRERLSEEEQILARIAEGDHVKHYETVRVTKAGDRRLVSIAVSPLRNPGGTVVGASKIMRDITELKHAEEALRRTTERELFLADTVENATTAFGVGAPDGRLLLFNRAFAELTGYSRQELEDPSLGWAGTLTPPEWHEKEAEALARAVRDRTSVRYEKEYRRKDGTRVPIELVVQPVFQADGTLLHYRSFVIDSTERRRAVAALRESEERLRLATSAADLGIFEWDVPSDVARWENDRMYEVFGRNRAEGPIGRDAFYAEALEPEDRLVFDRALADAMRPGALFRVACRIRRRNDREQRWIEYAGRFELASDGSPARLVGVIQDITDRKRAEEAQRRAEQALLRSREGLRGLADASLSVMSATSFGDMLQAISEAALALTGARLATCGHGFVSGQYVVGGSARAPGVPACPPGEMFVLEKGGVHMALIDGAESIRLTDAELRAHAEWWGLPAGHVPMRGLLGVRMLARNGKPNGMILVTDKDPSGGSAGDFNSEDEALLKQLATVASLALQHVEARISLEESDRRKNQFLAMLSHELRNPLAPIRNSLYILDRAKPGGEQAQRAQAVIGRQIGHMTRLVDELLDVTRISRGKIQLEYERLDVCDVARRAVEDYREAFKQSHIAIDLSLPEGPLWVDADPTRLAQVIGNLLSNSAKFTPAGGKTAVTVEGSRELGQAIVRVRDTGIGIAPEMLPRVFEPFAQADTTLDRNKGGLGLGLAMVKGLVEMHGGTASVESAGIGRGAEFTVRFPIDLADLPVEQAIVRRARNGGPRRVLVIEDNVDAAESLRDVLELAEHIVEVAFSGSEGLEKAQRFAPDVVLCDIGLPGIDGYQVAREMRRDPALRKARLVALTGYAAPDDIAEARDAGFDDHLAKPPSPEKLEELLGATHRS